MSWFTRGRRRCPACNRSPWDVARFRLHDTSIRPPPGNQAEGAGGVNPPFASGSRRLMTALEVMQTRSPTTISHWTKLNCRVRRTTRVRVSRNSPTSAPFTKLLVALTVMAPSPGSCQREFMQSAASAIVIMTPPWTQPYSLAWHAPARTPTSTRPSPVSLYQWTALTRSNGSSASTRTNPSGTCEVLLMDRFPSGGTLAVDEGCLCRKHG